MNGQGGYQQLPCVRCGQSVWIEMTTRQGVCQSCGNVNSMQPPPMAMGAPPPMPMGAPPSMPMGPMGAPPMPGYGGYAGPGYPNQMPGQMPMQGSVPLGQAPMPGMQLSQGAMAQAPMPSAAPMPQPQPTPSNPAAMYQNPRKHVVKGVAGAIAVAVLGGGGYYAKNKFENKPGKVSYASLRIDARKAEPDQLIDSVSRIATRWKRDAAWWAVNVSGIRPDGTVDLKGGATAQVTYISPSRVQSMAKTQRADSIKKFSFGPTQISHDRKWEPTKAWKDVVLPSTPDCSIAELVAHLRTKGFESGTVRVSFDPQFAFAVKGYAWKVQDAAQAQLNGWFSMEDCTLIKPEPK